VHLHRETFQKKDKGENNLRREGFQMKLQWQPLNKPHESVLSPDPWLGV